MENELKQSIASMSHDLRTPLTAIMGYLQLMKNETEKSGIGEYLEIASRRAKMLETLINDFFEISMIEVHQFPISIEAVELNSVLAQHIADYYNNFLNKGIQLKVDIQEQPVKIMADKNALDRIITNLIGNAYEHSSTEVSIRLYEDEKTAAFEISNYADNLSIEDTQKIFDRFFMADKVRNGQSSGLGLSIVKA
jgi:signal transduction histidine kinase